MRSIILSILFLAAIPTMAQADGDAGLGEKVFRKCRACHMVGEDAKAKAGPVLNGVMGRQAGTLESFEGKYSKAMIEAGEGGLVWNEETMSDYLEKPKELVPKTKMSFAGLKKEDERANVIAYIITFSPDYSSGE